VVLKLFWGAAILTVLKKKFWQFGKSNFDSLKSRILTVWKVEFWQFEKSNFDSLKSRILTVWKVEFWQFKKGNFDSSKRKIRQSRPTVWEPLKIKIEKFKLKIEGKSLIMVSG
jgi:hypothetical protein